MDGGGAGVRGRVFAGALRSLSEVYAGHGFSDFWRCWDLNVTRSFLSLIFAVVISGFCAPYSPAQEAPSGRGQPSTTENSSTAQSISTTPEVPRCGEISAAGPQFDLLGGVCEYALSPRSLPNFICEETIERRTNGHKLDVVTAEVTYRNHRDHYSNYTIDQRPVDSIERTGGWVSNALFAAQLNAIFREETKASFKFDRDTKMRSEPAGQFTFRFDKSGSPGFSLSSVYPAMSGSIWIDRSSGHLLRVETATTKVDHTRPLKSYKSVLNYGEVPIAGLGKLLLPESGQEDVCLNTGACFRNNLSFHDCRKFGSEVRIVPNAGVPAP